METSSIHIKAGRMTEFRYQMLHLYKKTMRDFGFIKEQVSSATPKIVSYKSTRHTDMEL